MKKLFLGLSVVFFTFAISTNTANGFESDTYVTCDKKKCKHKKSEKSETKACCKGKSKKKCCNKDKKGCGNKKNPS